MAGSLIIISIIALILMQIAIPAYLIYWVGWNDNRSKFHLITKLLLSWVYCIYIYLAGQWSFVPFTLRYVMLAGLLYASIRPLISFKELIVFTQPKIWGWIKIIFQFTMIVIFLMGVFEVINGKTTDEAGIDIGYPLKSGFIAHGGNSVIINYHNADSTAQTYALDITNINRLGLRAIGFFPEDLEKYEVFADTLYAPFSGRVVEVKDGLDNMKVGEMDRENITGNYIVMAYEGNMVFMGHLLKNSLLVDSGDIVKAGDPLAQIGNSGHTSEPHLHIHAVKGNDPSKILDGESVPIYIDGKFLCRNDRFSK